MCGGVKLLNCFVNDDSKLHLPPKIPQQILNVDIFLITYGIRWVMVFNATVDNISVLSWQYVFLVEETGVPGKNHRPIASDWQN